MQELNDRASIETMQVGTIQQKLFMISYGMILYSKLTHDIITGPARVWDDKTSWVRRASKQSQVLLVAIYLLVQYMCDRREYISMESFFSSVVVSPIQLVSLGTRGCDWCRLSLDEITFSLSTIAEIAQPASSPKLLAAAPRSVVLASIAAA